MTFLGFPGSSAGKESSCNAGGLGLIPRLGRASLVAQLVKNPPAIQETPCIPGSGRSAGEGISYPLQYSWAALVTQTLKNLLAMQETWVLTSVGKIPLEKGMATPSSILAWRIPMDRVAWQAVGSQNVRYD